MDAVKQKKTDDNELVTGGGIQAPSGPAAPGIQQGRTAAFSTGQPNTNRFTNLQKYIGANAGAGDRLASGITKKVEQQNQPKAKEADTSASAVREGIQSSKDKLQVGNQFAEQLQAKDFNADTIAKDENKLNQFTDFRTGKAIDSEGLAAQGNIAQQNNLAYQEQLQRQLQQTATDQGRYGLLKSAFGGGTAYQNPYSTGQQRLDQLFLQSGGNNGIGTLQNNLRTNVNQVGNQLNTLGQNMGEISNIGTQAKDLATGLQDTATGMTNKFIGDIEATEGDVNAARAAEQAWADTQFKNLQGNQKIDRKFADTLGLNQGQHLFGSVSDKNVNDFLKFGATNLTGANQLADEQQRKYYQSLAAISGANPQTIDLNFRPEAATSFIDGSTQSKIIDPAKAAAAELAKRTASGSVGNGVVGANANLSSLQSLMDSIDKQGVNNFDNIRNVSREELTKYYNPNNQFNYATPNDTTSNVLSNLNNLNSGVTYDNQTNYVDQGRTGAVSGASADAILAALRQLSEGGFYNAVNIAE